MKATTHFPATFDPGWTVQTTAMKSWQSAQAPQPIMRTVRLSMYRVKPKLKRQPRRPMQVIMTDMAKAFSTPAMVRKYVV
jgi:hypothetical protein